jgi:thymidylate synthase (FAD)
MNGKTLRQTAPINSVSVLDNGFVHLVDYMGSDLTVVNSARVSFSKESKWKNISDDGITDLIDQDKKLISYLAEHNHWTPFAHPQITMRIKAPISIRTQFFKHKQGFVENEISRRYVKEIPEIYLPKWRGAPIGEAKQGSKDFLKFVTTITDIYQHLIDEALDVYKTLLEEGVAPEQARFVLPQGTYTEWYWTGSLAAYGRFYKQRIHPHAQWEIRQYAEAVGSIIEPLFPMSWKALTGKNNSTPNNSTA